MVFIISMKYKLAEPIIPL